MKVKDLMSTSITCARLDSTIKAMITQMKQENIGVLPICTDMGRVLGIVTDRDIVLRSFGNDALTARKIMTKNVISAAPNMDTHDAALLMAKNQVRRLPVIENDKLVGILAIADIARKKFYVDEAGDAIAAISKVSTLS